MEENFNFESYHEYALSALNILCKAADVELTHKDRALLSLNTGSTEQYGERISEVREAIYQGFFNCAKRGSAVHPKTKISPNDVRTIYPDSNKTFHNFARTYLSLSRLTHEISESDIQQLGAAKLLEQLEQIIGPVFFPTHKPSRKDRVKLKQMQKEFISKGGASINVEELVEGNPILHSKKGTGQYLLWASLIVAILVTIIELFWLGKSGLAWVVIALAIAIGLQSIYLIKKG